jgi:hypothetical protein
MLTSQSHYSVGDFNSLLQKLVNENYYILNILKGVELNSIISGYFHDRPYAHKYCM